MRCCGAVECVMCGAVECVMCGAVECVMCGAVECVMLWCGRMCNTSGISAMTDRAENASGVPPCGTERAGDARRD